VRHSGVGFGACVDSSFERLRRYPRQVKLPLFSLMRSRHCSVVAFVLASLLAWATPASAEWSELVKDDDITYYFDNETVMPVQGRQNTRR
jgi:hypothetical protein